MKKDFKRLLVIDDDVEECMILEAAIQQVDDQIDFLCMHDGRQVISVIDTFQPTIVLTDMIMPLTTGVDCLKEIKRRFPDLPVIVYSGLPSKDQVIKAYEQGCELVVQKPSSFRGLVNIIKAIFALDWANKQKIRDTHYGSLVDTFEV